MQIIKIESIIYGIILKLLEGALKRFHLLLKKKKKALKGSGVYVLNGSIINI
jgi:hypothetical protein